MASALSSIYQASILALALDNNKDNIDKINMILYKLEKRIELLLLMYEINVFTVKLFKRI